MYQRFHLLTFLVVGLIAALLLGLNIVYRDHQFGIWTARVTGWPLLLDYNSLDIRNPKDLTLRESEIPTEATIRKRVDEEFAPFKSMYHHFHSRLIVNVLVAIALMLIIGATLERLAYKREKKT